MTADNGPPLVHFSNDDDSAGLCGTPGFLVESWPHVTCVACLDVRPWWAKVPDSCDNDRYCDCPRCCRQEPA